MSRLQFFVLLALAIGLCSCEHISNVKKCKLGSYRLPRDIEPTNYEIYIKPNLDNFRLDGRVKIDVHALSNDECEHKSDGGCNLVSFFKNVAIKSSARRQIVLHAASNIDIDEVEFIMDGVQVPIEDVCFDKANEQISVKLAKDFEAGSSGVLSIGYVTEMTHHIAGSFISEYTGRDGKRRYYLATEFEPTQARRAFPCFDEPSLKSTFDMVIEHSSDLDALSNMDKVETTDMGATKITRFEKTPKMSTYLVAFVVGQFDYAERHVLDGKMRIRVYTPPGKSAQAEGPVETAARAFNVLNDYFNVEQPVKKVDFFPLRNYEDGAMENWGLIIIKDTLIEPHAANTERAVSYTHTIVHELAHMWFGNLVTMKWWDDLWLNEGFTDWLSYDKVDEMFPHYQYRLGYQIDSLSNAMNFDMSADARQVRQIGIEKASMAEMGFGPEAYGKFAAMVRIMAEFVGRKPFETALENYIKDNQYRNTEASDLWDSVRSVTGVDINEIMDSWLEQPGHPMLSVDFDGGEKRKIKIQQERNMNQLGRKEKKQVWIVPVTLLVSDGDKRTEEVKFLVKTKSHVAALPKWFDASKGHWFKLNANFGGFYRSEYSKELLELLKGPIVAKMMPPADRINILADFLNLLIRDRISPEEAREFLSWFEGEDNTAVLLQLVAFLKKFGYGAIHDMTETVLLKHYRQMGLDVKEEETELETRLRAQIIELLVTMPHEPTVKEVYEFAQLNQEKLHESLEEPVRLARINLKTDAHIDHAIGPVYESIR